jgi:AraC-like DNA-binding protein
VLLVLTTVASDTRGIVHPEVGLRRFELTNFAPSPGVARLVERYWVAAWDLRGHEPHVQRVLPHPVANVCFESTGASVHGVITGQTIHRLEGQGRAVGITFRPGGFRPYIDHPMSVLTDRVRSMRDVFGQEGEALEQGVAATDGDSAVPLIDQFLSAWPARAPAIVDELSEMIERVATDPSLVRVEALARGAAMSTRQLERLFNDHVGVGPKWVICRYRFYEAAQRAAAGSSVRWALVAAELGYSDQAHLSRDFQRMLGMTPREYASGTPAGRSTES